MLAASRTSHRMIDDDPNEDPESGPDPTGSDFVPENSSPPMDPPGLEKLNLKGAAVRQQSPPLASYVTRDDAGDAPVLRDTPFGGDAPGIFGGETPFFQSEAPGFDFEMDDTEGIPTGLPDLHDLSAFEDWVPAPTDKLPEPSGPVMPDVLGIDVVQEALDEAGERHARIVEALETRMKFNQLVAGSVGIIVSSLLWGTLLYLALQSQ
jgi:hypothetical protein